ncbi:MAG: VIT1/CCC1 transporter family protein [Alphaproteobacteria bacterium]|nr:VIT1/CCC1 transporter family protein [Alphaproteobacteria bacterium]
MKVCPKEHLATIKSFQKDEATASLLYLIMAKSIKDKKNRRIMLKMAKEEKAHSLIWKQYTNLEIKPNKFKVFFYSIINYILGYTFVIKLLEANEYNGITSMDCVKDEFPEIEHIIAQEKAHENSLIEMLDEERLNYTGAMVLGLNDALVELTGAIAGLTFVLMNTSLIAMSGVITGIAATLSMAASNYLAERANGNSNALKASIYTGIAYLITVVFLTLPYLVLPNDMYVMALCVMITTVVVLIYVFSFYIATVKSEKVMPRFLEMAGISLSVALISFLIGILAKFCFGIEV